VRSIRSRRNFYYAVQMPSLDLYFLGEGLASGWNLVAVQSDARLSMKKGDGAPAVPALLRVANIYGLR